MSTDSVKVMSDITVFNKYAKFVQLWGRRETWEDICHRNRDMHIKKYPSLEKEIRKVYKDFVIPKKILMSMRSAQFAGKPIELNPTRIYNCCFAPVDDYRVFGEVMFLLLGGTGVGFSVQRNHVDKLPEITKPTKQRKYVIGDSIEGWADAVKVLCKAYFTGKPKPRFIFDDIRPKGARLVTSGGKAPGPAPLKMCLTNIENILESKNNGEKLTTLECHDIMCYIADAVLAGGIRRAALISMFDIDDNSMLTCKFGNWWELNPQRGRANNSAVVLRHKIKKPEFLDLWKKIEASKSGEPGIYFSNNESWGSNPCCFTGDTPILTKDGYQNLSSLVGKEVELVNVRGELHKGSVWSTGTKEIIQLKNSIGEIVRCTPDHRFMDIEGNEVQAQDLKGKRVMPHLDVRTENDHYTKLGFIQGDGVTGRLDSHSHKGIDINIGQDDQDINLLFDIDPEEGKRTFYVNGFNGELRDLGFDSNQLPERNFPKTYDDWTEDQQLSFLRGMYSANGCVIKGQRVSYKTTCNSLACDLVDNLREFGIEAYITTNKSKDVKFSNGTYTCRESYDVNISRYDSVRKFSKLIGFVHEYKNIDLKDLLVKKSPVITSIKSVGSEEVFDFNIDDDTHWGVVGEGYVAHNCEIALRPYQFCNLTEINMSDIQDQEDLNARAKAAAFLGTLQAGYTDFHYLREVWKKTTERDALIGVSGTGIASKAYENCDLTEATECVIAENERVAEIIGINAAARTTCVKPAGTTSLVLGTSSGIHAWYAPYYIRRIRLGKNEALYSYVKKNIPDLVEDCFFKPDLEAVLSIPIKAPSGGIFRDETAIDLLERIKKFSEEWVKPGHKKGDNTHNVSATVSVRDSEWKEVGEWMWKNRDCYNGLAVLPYDGGTYTQAPFEEISKSKYYKMEKLMKNIDLKKVKEDQDNTDLSGELACAAGHCEI